MPKTKEHKKAGKSKLLLKAVNPRRMGDGKHLHPLELTIEGSTVFANDVTRVLVVNQLVITLTPIEYALLTFLLEQPGIPVSFEALSQAAFSANVHEKKPDPRLLARHITNIRPKLWETPLNIHAVNNFGYVLRLSESPAQLAQKKRKDG